MLIRCCCCQLRRQGRLVEEAAAHQHTRHHVVPVHPTSPVYLYPRLPQRLETITTTSLVTVQGITAAPQAVTARGHQAVLVPGQRRLAPALPPAGHSPTARPTTAPPDSALSNSLCASEQGRKLSLPVHTHVVCYWSHTAPLPGYC